MRLKETATQFSMLVSLLLLLLVGCGGGNGSKTTTSTPDLSGKWNIVLTDSGSASPTYTFGLSIAQSGSVLTAQAAGYTGGTSHGTSCANFGDATAVGTISNSALTLTVTDASTGAVFTLSGTASASTVDGTFSFPGRQEGHQICNAVSGSLAMTRQ